jgi:hypothetical protein
VQFPLIWPAQWDLSHSFNASFMRDCQPSPVALNASNTSASKRMVVLIFVPLPAGLPRRFLASACASSRDTTLSPIRQTPSLKNASVSSGASSGSTHALGIFCNFALICFPHTICLFVYLPLDTFLAACNFS